MKLETLPQLAVPSASALPGSTAAVDMALDVT